MPIIKLEAVKMSQEQKEKLMDGLTKVASEILGIKTESFLVLIKENDFDNWGVGGKILSKLVQENPDRFKN